MQRHLLTRLTICAALAGSAASVAAVAAPGGIAGAAAKTLSCKTLTGSGTATSQTIALSGCTGTASNQTGAKGTATVKTSASSKKGTVTIKWTSTKKTSIESYTYVEDTGSKNTCAAKSGYTKLAMAVEKGSVTGGTATELRGGAVTATVCAYSKSGKIWIFNKGPVKS
jgi:hypothetical protein